jgi:predicted peroxiredoxin
MSEKKKLLVVVTNGFHDERSSAALTIANSGINTGLDVTMFLISSGVDLVRKGAADRAQLNPLDPTLGEMIDNFLASGGTVLICPACAKVRGYEERDMIEGVAFKSSTAMHELIKEGAATMSF